MTLFKRHPSFYSKSTTFGKQVSYYIILPDSSFIYISQNVEITFTTNLNYQTLVIRMFSSSAAFEFEGQGVNIQGAWLPNEFSLSTIFVWAGPGAMHKIDGETYDLQVNMKWHLINYLCSLLNNRYVLATSCSNLHSGCTFLLQPLPQLNLSTQTKHYSKVSKSS